MDGILIESLCLDKYTFTVGSAEVLFFSFSLLDFTALFVTYPIPSIRYFSILPKTSVVNVKMLCAYVCIYPHKRINKKTIQKEFKVILQK